MSCMWEAGLARHLLRKSILKLRQIAPNFVSTPSFANHVRFVRWVCAPRGAFLLCIDLAHHNLWMRTYKRNVLIRRRNTSRNGGEPLLKLRGGSVNRQPSFRA